MADSWFADCADFADCEDCADCGKVEADCKLHIFTTGLKCKNLLFILALDIKMCHTQLYHICATFTSTIMQLCTFHNFEQIIANKHYKSVKLPLHHNLGAFKGSLGGCSHSYSFGHSFGRSHGVGPDSGHQKCLKSISVFKFNF